MPLPLPQLARVRQRREQAQVLETIRVADHVLRNARAPAVERVVRNAVRRRVEEPEVWKRSRDAGTTRANPYRVLFGAAMRNRTLLACLLTGFLQFAYWGLFFWLPNLLASPIEKGGAGMTVVKSVASASPPAAH